MKFPFIERNLFTKVHGKFEKTRICISKPFSMEDKMFSCKVSFSNIPKYDAVSKGFDEFNSVECALDYVSAICMNSDDPEFFITKTESMKGVNRDGDGIFSVS